MTLRPALSRTRLALLAIACAGLLGLALSNAQTADAGVIESYCSPQTGDFCYAVAKRGGKVKLEIQTFSFSDYSLCVRGPERRVCLDRHMSENEGIFSDRVDFARTIGSQGAGRCKASWRVGGVRIGPALKFHP